MYLYSTIICPGCCLTGTREQFLARNARGRCPNCGYEDLDGSLLTVGELMDLPSGEYNNVDLPNFLRAVIDLVSNQ